MRTKMNRLWAILALVVTVTGFAACMKTENTQPQRPQALYWFTSAYASNLNYDVFDNDQKLNQSALTYGFLTYYYSLRGTHQFKFKKSGSDSVIATTINSYDSLNSYTMILHGDSSIGATLTSIHDDYTGTSNSKVNYRFYHLSPSIGAVDFYLNDTKLATSRNYDGQGGFYSGFSTADLTGSASVKVKAAGKDSVIAQKDNIPFSSGYVYTIYLKGISGNTGDRKPIIDIIQHN